MCFGFLFVNIEIQNTRRAICYEWGVMPTGFWHPTLNSWCALPKCLLSDSTLMVLSGFVEVLASGCVCLPLSCWGAMRCVLSDSQTTAAAAASFPSLQHPARQCREGCVGQANIVQSLGCSMRVWGSVVQSSGFSMPGNSIVNPVSVTAVASVLYCLHLAPTPWHCHQNKPTQPVVGVQV